MKIVWLLLAVASLSWAQTPGTHGRSATGHGPSQWPGYLGVGIVEVTQERAKTLNLAAASGVEVKHVDDNSPAARAGLKTDDVILELNGQKVESVVQFIGTIGVSAPGTKMTLAVWREGSKRTLTATLESRPALSAAYTTDPDGTFMTLPTPFDIMTFPNPGIGIDGEALTPQLAEFFGVKEGVLIRSVNSRSPAEKAGLKAGDVIIKVAGTPVTSPREIAGLVRPGHRTLPFTVVRNHKEITFNLEIALEFDPWRDPGSLDGPSLAYWLVR
jgi:serine protease Do